MALSKRQKMVAKTFTYKLSTTFATLIVVGAITGDWRKALGAGGLDAIVKTLVYLGHETVWSKWEA